MSSKREREAYPAETDASRDREAGFEVGSEDPYDAYVKRGKKKVSRVCSVYENEASYQGGSAEAEYGEEEEGEAEAGEKDGNPGCHSYQLHAEIKHQIAEVLEAIRLEVKRHPEAYVQVRNRTWASINKRYLYERSHEKSVRCLEDAKKLLQKYRALTGGCQ